MPDPTQLPDPASAPDRARSEAEIAAFLDATGLAQDLGDGEIRDLEDGTYVVAKPLMFHWTLIRGAWDDTLGYFDRWCYADRDGALAALAAFPLRPDPRYEPTGWHRHPMSGRRRPDGTSDTEIVAP